MHPVLAVTEFQSTPSGGKATESEFLDAVSAGSFNPRLPGGRRPLMHQSELGSIRFQSTPSGGKATFETRLSPEPVMFQSTPSGGKATRRLVTRRHHQIVSIHAFRGEGDLLLPARLTGILVFQSTPSGGKATEPSRALVQAHGVSIHAFRGEGDIPFSISWYASVMFQSTPSGGKATRFRL